MGRNEKKSMKDTAYYQEIERIHRQYYEVLAPLSVALFGEEGHTKEYDPQASYFGTGMKTKIEDSTRSNVVYGIAVLLSEGMSIEDIFDPTKELEKKREAGERFKTLANNEEREKICEIYEKATERISNELDFEVKDNLLDNTKDVKNAILRKALFDMNQRFGEHKQVFSKLLEERYKNQGFENYKEKATERYNQIYGAQDRFQVLASIELKPLNILRAETDNIAAIEVLTSFEQWKREKDKIKLAHKEMSKEDTQELLMEDALNLASLPPEFGHLDIAPQELLADVLSSEAGLENPLMEAQAYKELSNRTTTEYALDLFAPHLQDILGTPIRPESRILIEDKPIGTLLIDRSEKMTREKIAQMLTEAALEGKTISIFKEDKATGRTMDEPTTIDVQIPDYMRPRLSRTLPTTHARTTPKCSKEQLEERIRGLSNNIKQEEKIVFSAGFQTISDIRYKNNLLGAEICRSIFGDDAVRSIGHADAMNLTATAMKQKGFLRYARSGVALGAAVLLSQGMSLEEIMNPDVRQDEKRAAGKLLEELGAQGVEGRRKLALMAADAMEKLHKGQYVNISEDMFSNLGNVSSVFASQVMFELNQEAVGSVLNLKDAYEDKFSKDYPDLSKEERNKMVTETYNRVGSYVAPYQMAKASTFVGGRIMTETPEEWAFAFMRTSYMTQNLTKQIFSENMYETERTEERMLEYNQGEWVKVNYANMTQAANVSGIDMLIETGVLDDPTVNVDLRFQQISMQKMYEALEAVDPAYLRSSTEFRGMKTTMKEILEHYNKAGESPSLEWRNTLASKYQKLSNYNSRYLKLKEGRELKEGSNGQKRYDVAKRIEDFTKAAIEINENTNTMLNKASLAKAKAAIKKRLENIEIGSKRCDDFASPTTVDFDDKKPKEERTFEERCFAVKKKENDIKSPETLNLDEKELGLLAMISVGSEKVASSNHNVPEKCNDDDRAYITVSALVEDIYNQRDGFDEEKMFQLEDGRKEIGEAFSEFSAGNKERLGRLLAEGLRRYTSTFSAFDNGLRLDASQEKKIVALKKAGEIYDMLVSHPKLLELATDSALGKDKLTKDVLETYRGAKMIYDVHQKAERAKLELLDTNFSEKRTPEKMEKIKNALADITLQNIISQDIARSFSKEYGKVSNALDEKYGIATDIEDDEVHAEYKVAIMVGNAKLKMSENTKKLTQETVDRYRNKLVGSKVIEQLAINMNVGHVAKIFSDESVFFDTVANQIKQKEPAVLKEKELNLAAGVTQKETEMTLSM